MTKKQLEERNERLLALVAAFQVYLHRLTVESAILTKALEEAVRDNPDAKS